VLLRVQHDEELATGDIRKIKQQSDDGSLATFAAGADLHAGFYLLDPYVGVVLGPLTPAVWGFSAHRGRGLSSFRLDFS